MEDMQFTPGPWKVEASTPHDGFECYYIRVDREFGPITDGNRVTEIGSVNGPQWKEQLATANLIAAAPDLYEALHDILECLGHQECVRAQRAMAKARGEL